VRPFDATHAFRPIAEHGGLKRVAVRSAGVTVFSQGVAFAAQMVGTIVLARLLRPADFGVVTMVTTFSLLLSSFGVNGFNEAVLQRDEIDHFLASNLFWINLAVGAGLSLIFAAAGSLLARFYRDPRVTYVAVGISITIFIASTSVLHLALLKRAMCFTEASINDIAARVVAVVLSISLAWAGWGYWALVAGVIAQPLALTIGAWTLCRWLPALPRRSTGTRSVLRFATHVYGRFSVNYFARNMDNLLVGWRFGSGPLGFYKKAYDLFVLPANQLLSPVSDVALSTLSRMQHDSAQYRRYFLRGLSILALVGMAVGADLTLTGKDLIRLLLGPGWEEAGRIFTFFGPGSGVMLIYGTVGMIHLSLGKPDRWFRWVVAEFTVTGLLFLLGLRYGPAGIAMAWTASFWILVVPAFWYAGRPMKFGVSPMVAAVWRYVLAALVAGYGSSWVMRGMPALAGAPGSAGAVERIVTISLIFSVLYAAAVVLLHGGCEPFYQVARLVPDMLPWARLSQSRRRPEASNELAEGRAENLVVSRGD
jgi:O-antigen/teichoic acid export membrane protein